MRKITVGLNSEESGSELPSNCCYCWRMEGVSEESNFELQILEADRNKMRYIQKLTDD